VVEVLFCTSLVALVGAGEQPAFSPRRLKLFNTSTMATIHELNFVTMILKVRMNRKRLVVVLDTKVHIFDLSNVQLLQTMDTVSNPKGLSALSSEDSRGYVAYPSSTTTGEVMLYDAQNLYSVGVIQAHKSPLGCLAFNTQGTMLATASEKGTVIRVFSVPEGHKLYTFRRGSYFAEVHSLSFNISGSLLCVSSENGTVHIFKLDEPGTAAGSSSPLSAYMPEFVSNIVEPSRAFATVHLSQASLPSLSAINASSDQVMVVTALGVLYQYQLDPIKGGECKLIREHFLLEKDAGGEATAGWNNG
jgi:autophagy-related protein 18